MSSSASPRSSRKPFKVRQACDNCHKRKIRCDGCRPCLNCRGSEVDCTYLAVHKKTGPRGPRHARKSPLPSPGQYISYFRATEAASPSPSGKFLQSPEISEAIIQYCLDAYFEHKYPLTPILDRQQLEQTPTTPEQYGLITVCCAVIALSPEILPPDKDDFTIPSADFLISETLRAREYCDLVGQPSLTHIQTSFFLYAAFFSMDKDNLAWHHLQEAITMLQALRLHEEATYNDSDDPRFISYARRMFWVLFITERAYALQRDRPTRLRDVLKPPVVDPMSSDARILPGFLDLISLFRPFDPAFIAHCHSPALSTSTDSIRLSKLQCLLQYSPPDLSNFSQVQQADLLISREWLKMVVWKLCASKRVLKAADSEDAMSLYYPASIARNVVLVSHLVPTQAFEANGIGILEKVFDVGCSLADLLSLQPLGSQGSTMDVGGIDTLMEMVRIVGTRFGGNYRHLDMLVDKASRCLFMNVDRSLPLPVDEGCNNID